MDQITIALIAPSGAYQDEILVEAVARSQKLGFAIKHPAKKFMSGAGSPRFINGNVHQRLTELEAIESADVDAIWCVRGGCGAIEMWPHYQASIYRNTRAPLIGYSDITIYHLMRYLRAQRIGIHGPVFNDLAQGDLTHVEALSLLVSGRAERLIYPSLTNLNHSLSSRISGELLPMNLASLQSVVGCIDRDFFHGKILALEDIAEPPYKVYRFMHHLRNAGILSGLKGLIIGYFSDERQQIIDETMLPIANHLGVPVFDWPIFGHDRPNWPLLFGARVTVKKIQQEFFTLTYNEQHDHQPIRHDTDSSA